MCTSQWIWASHHEPSAMPSRTFTWPDNNYCEVKTVKEGKSTCNSTDSWASSFAMNCQDMLTEALDMAVEAHMIIYTLNHQNCLCNSLKDCATRHRSHHDSGGILRHRPHDFGGKQQCPLCPTSTANIHVKLCLSQAMCSGTCWTVAGAAPYSKNCAMVMLSMSSVGWESNHLGTWTMQLSCTEYRCMWMEISSMKTPKCEYMCRPENQTGTESHQ